MYTPTDEDFALLDQSQIILYLSVQIINKDGVMVDEVHGMIDGGSFSIDATSDVRRTMSVKMTPINSNGDAIWNGVMPNATFDMSERANLWIDNKEILKCGIKNVRTDQIKWYQLGVFILQDENLTYDATTHEMTINCGDLMLKLNGTVNGQLGQLTIKIPAYEEDSNGNPTKYNIVRDAMVKTITQLGGVQNYIVDDIGELDGMAQYNANYQAYRTAHPLWNNVPYDLEFSAGCTVLDIVTKLRDLYPNYETYFDEYGVFVCGMIPTCYYDTVYLRDDILQKYLISESVTRKLDGVRNVVEVWGESLDADYYSEAVTNSGGVYSCSISGMTDKYMNGDKVALKVPSTNGANQKINISGLGNLDIYNEELDVPLAAGTLEANNVYVFTCKKIYDSSAKAEYLKFYLSGAYQCHGLAVLSDGTTEPNGWTDPDTGTVYNKYSKEYFQTKYNCKNCEVWVIPDSPFTVQKIGERMDCKTGDEYSSITADSLALARAHYELWKDARLTDSITLTTLIMPWLDVNTKVTYKPQNSQFTNQYIIKNVSHDFSEMKTTIEMMTFYPLYEDTNAGGLSR